MGWWEIEKDIKLGDGVLDITEEFLEKITQEYLDDLGRKPKLIEVLRTIELILKHRTDEFIDGEEGFYVGLISGKMKRRPKKQKFHIGDVIAIPLKSNVFAYAILTPQNSLIEFFQFKSKKIVIAECLEDVVRVQLPYLVDLEPLKIWKWKIIGQLPYDQKKFIPQQFLIGGQVTCGNDEVNGFIDVSSKLCTASDSDLNTLTKMSMVNEEYLINDIEKRLKDVAIL